jgi:hypothetical protein
MNEVGDRGMAKQVAQKGGTGYGYGMGQPVVQGQGSVVVQPAGL